MTSSAVPGIIMFDDLQYIEWILINARTAGNERKSGLRAVMSF